jgi:hypothetical protein
LVKTKDLCAHKSGHSSDNQVQVQVTKYATARFNNALSMEDSDDEEGNDSTHPRRNLDATNYQTDAYNNSVTEHHVPKQAPDDMNLYKQQIAALKKQNMEGARCLNEINKLREEENKESAKYIVELQKLHKEEIATANNKLLEISKKHRFDVLKKQDTALNLLNKKASVSDKGTKRTCLTNNKNGSKKSKNVTTQISTSEANVIIQPPITEANSDWDLPYDKNKPFIDYASPKYDSTAQMVTIVNVRKRKGKPVELMVEWTCGSVEWGTINNVWSDVGTWDVDRTMFKNYKESHGYELIQKYMKNKKV